MRIGIDVRFAVHERRGIANYGLNLVQNLADMDERNQYILYVDRDECEILPKRRNVVTRVLKPSNYALWEQIVLPLQAVRDGIDILHCTGNTAPVFLDRRIRLITTIHDVMFLKNGEVLPKSVSLYQRAGRWYRRTVVPMTARRLSAVITVSEFSKRDVLKSLPELNGTRVKVTREAPGEIYRAVDRTAAARRIREKYAFDADYILTLGAVDPRKNTDRVIRAFADLKRTDRIPQKLVVVGLKSLPQGADGQDLKGQVITTGYVCDEELVDLYNGASIFLYPSLYEGFGIPPLEAMACGTPVITSNVTSIPEIAGDAAVLIDPRNDEQLRHAIRSLLGNAALRAELSRRGLERAKGFSWRKMAEETLELYESVRVAPSVKGGLLS
jgi:glycosyltransferase involved in cell wall biosynthesis